MSSTPPPIGTRVMAVSHSEGKTLYVFGHGTFEGYFLPPSVNVEEAVAEIMGEYAKAKLVTPELAGEFTPEHARIALVLSESNPRIKLDNGKTVWGSECWWGDLESFARRMGGEGYTIVERDIDEARAESEKMAALYAEMQAAQVQQA